jgi:hypothetical protein
VTDRDADRVAGADLVESKSGECKQCTAGLLVGLVRVEGGTLRWRNFDATPIERNGLRVYVRHRCRL